MKVAGCVGGLTEGRLRVGLFIVDGHVTYSQRLFILTNTTKYPLHKIEDDRRHQGRPTYDPGRRQELFPELMERVSVEPAVDRESARALVVRAGDSVLNHVRVREDSDQETPYQTGDAVGVDHAEGVIDLGKGSDLGEVVPREPDNG